VDAACEAAAAREGEAAEARDAANRRAATLRAEAAAEHTARCDAARQVEVLSAQLEGQAAARDSLQAAHVRELELRDVKVCLFNRQWVAC
jgi:hypothetical protein